jgi:hypothetical protein
MDYFFLRLPLCGRLLALTSFDLVEYSMYSEAEVRPGKESVIFFYLVNDYTVMEYYGLANQSNGIRKEKS